MTIVGWRASQTFSSEALQPAAARLSELVRQQELQVGDPAPRFELESSTGDGVVSLTGLLGKQPLVLIFGSYSCPYFREHARAINALQDEYTGQAQFLMVYIREAHPHDVDPIPENVGLVTIHTAKSIAQRKQHAQLCNTNLQLRLPTVVDDLGNRVSKLYRAWPERGFVISPAGQIVYKSSGPGSIDCRAIANILRAGDWEG